MEMDLRTVLIDENDDDILNRVAKDSVPRSKSQLERHRRRPTPTTGRQHRQHPPWPHNKRRQHRRKWQRGRVIGSSLHLASFPKARRDGICSALLRLYSARNFNGTSGSNPAALHWHILKTKVWATPKDLQNVLHSKRVDKLRKAGTRANGMPAEEPQLRRN